MSDSLPVSELSTITCGDCGSTSWTIRMEQCSDGHTLIITTCANESCVERKRLVTGASSEQLLVWNEWDITSSFVDEDPLETCTPTNIN
jgi:hypothetical protein